MTRYRQVPYELRSLSRALDNVGGSSGARAQHIKTICWGVDEGNRRDDHADGDLRIKLAKYPAEGGCWLHVTEPRSEEERRYRVSEVVDELPIERIAKRLVMLAVRGLHGAVVHYRCRSIANRQALIGIGDSNGGLVIDILSRLLAKRGGGGHSQNSLKRSSNDAKGKGQSNSAFRVFLSVFEVTHNDTVDLLGSSPSKRAKGSVLPGASSSSSSSTSRQMGAATAASSSRRVRSTGRNAAASVWTLCEINSVSEARQVLSRAYKRSKSDLRNCFQGGAAVPRGGEGEPASHVFVKIQAYHPSTSSMSSISLVDVAGSHSAATPASSALKARRAASNISLQERQALGRQMLSLNRLLLQLAHMSDKAPRDMDIQGGDVEVTCARESRLTQQVVPVLLGGAEVTFLASISLDPTRYLDACNTLRIASRCERIWTLSRPADAAENKVDLSALESVIRKDVARSHHRSAAGQRSNPAAVVGRNEGNVGRQNDEKESRSPMGRKGSHRWQLHPTKLRLQRRRGKDQVHKNSDAIAPISRKAAAAMAESPDGTHSTRSSHGGRGGAGEGTPSGFDGAQATEENESGDNTRSTLIDYVNGDQGSEEGGGEEEEEEKEAKDDEHHGATHKSSPAEHHHKSSYYHNHLHHQQQQQQREVEAEEEEEPASINDESLLTHFPRHSPTLPSQRKRLGNDARAMAPSSSTQSSTPAKERRRENKSHRSGEAARGSASPAGFGNLTPCRPPTSVGRLSALRPVETMRGENPPASWMMLPRYLNGNLAAVRNGMLQYDVEFLGDIVESVFVLKLPDETTLSLLGFERHSGENGGGVIRRRAASRSEGDDDVLEVLSPPPSQDAPREQKHAAEGGGKSGFNGVRITLGKRRGSEVFRFASAQISTGYLADIIGVLVTDIFIDTAYGAVPANGTCLEFDRHNTTTTLLVKHPQFKDVAHQIAKEAASVRLKAGITDVAAQQRVGGGDEATDSSDGDGDREVTSKEGEDMQVFAEEMGLKLTDARLEVVALRTRLRKMEKGEFKELIEDYENEIGTVNRMNRALRQDNLSLMIQKDKPCQPRNRSIQSKVPSSSSASYSSSRERQLERTCKTLRSEVDLLTEQIQDLRSKERLFQTSRRLLRHSQESTNKATQEKAKAYGELQRLKTMLSKSASEIETLENENLTLLHQRDEAVKMMNSWSAEIKFLREQNRVYLRAEREKKIMEKVSRRKVARRKSCSWMQQDGSSSSELSQPKCLPALRALENAIARKVLPTEKVLGILKDVRQRVCELDEERRDALANERELMDVVLDFSEKSRNS